MSQLKSTSKTGCMIVARDNVTYRHGASGVTRHLQPATDTADTADTWHRWVQEVEIIRTQHQVSPQHSRVTQERQTCVQNPLHDNSIVFLYYLLWESGKRCSVYWTARRQNGCDRGYSSHLLSCCNLFCRVDNLVTSIWSPSVDT